MQLLDFFMPEPLSNTVLDISMLILAAAVAGWLLHRWSTLRALRAHTAAAGLLAAAAVAAAVHIAHLLEMPLAADLIVYGHVVALLLLLAALALLFRRLICAHQALSTARTARERFLAQISHELRTPLNSIIGFSQLSRSLLSKGRTDPEAFAAYQADIERSAGSLGRLIDDFADLAALEAGRLRLAREEVDLVEKVRCCEDLLHAAAEAKGLAFRTEAGGAPRVVRTDPVRVRQVLISVVNNAILYTERGEVGIRFIERPASWCVAVTDTGAGIASEQLGRLLQPLERGAADPLLAADGPGLGLALAHQLMRAMDGRLEIDSAPGRGTTVRLIWPKAGASKAAPAAPLTGRTVLSELA